MSHELRQPEFTDELLSAYLDGELTNAERMSVDQRLTTDEASRRLLDELATVSHSVRSLPVEPLGESVAADVVAAAHRLESAPQVMLADRAATNSPVTVGRSYRGWIYAAVAVAAALLVAYLPMLQFNEREVADLADAGRERRSTAETRRPELSDRDVVAADGRRPVPPAEMGGMGGGVNAAGAALAGRPADALMNHREGYVELGNARDANVYFVRVKLSPQAAREMQVEQAILRNSIQFIAGTPPQRMPTPPPVGNRPDGAAPEPTTIVRNDSSGQTRSPSEAREQLQPTDAVAGRQRFEPPQAGRATTPDQLIAIEAPLTQAGELLRELSEDASGILTLEVEPLGSGAAELSRWNRSALPPPIAQATEGQQGETPRTDLEVKEQSAIANAGDRLAGRAELSAESFALSKPSLPPAAAGRDRVDVRSPRGGVDVPPVSVASPDAEVEEKDEEAVTDVTAETAGKAIQLSLQPSWPEPLYAWFAAARTATSELEDSQRESQQQAVVDWFFDAFDGQATDSASPPKSPLDSASGTARILMWVEVAEETPIAEAAATPAAEVGQAVDPAAPAAETPPAEPSP